MLALVAQVVIVQVQHQLVPLMCAIKPTLGTARPNPNVRQQELIGIIIIALHHRHHNVLHRSYGTAMIRQVVKELRGIGVITIARVPHVLLAHQHKNITAMTRQVARGLGGAGVHRSMEEVVGVLIHVHPIHATRLIYGTAKQNLNAKR